MRLLFLLIVVCVFSLKVSFAQRVFHGSIKDNKGKPLEAVTVTLKDTSGNTINFARTNDKGLFSISYKEDQIAGFTIESSSIGYKKLIQKVADASKALHLIMEETELMLETVTVNNRPMLKTKGDTLNYRTSDFADKQDRSIGDVLKRMPGMEVAENGKITYNGKSISNLYVDGDNLLDDRYNIGTKSIPQGAVETVQVIQNDQPVKMLRKNNTSDDVALNLVIKDDAKLRVMGDATIGAGLPKRYDENLTAMLFNKKLKFINNLKGNNIGLDPGIDLTSHNISDYLKRLDNDKPDPLLSTGAAGVPSLPQSRYLFNNAGVANFNNLYNMKSGLQLKANIAYLYDQRREQYDKRSETYLSNDTIRYTEYQRNAINPQKLRTQFNLNANEDDYYLNNNFILDYTPVNTKSVFSINDFPANQKLTQRSLDVSNELNYRKKIWTDDIIHLYSFLNRTTQPELLEVTPGLNADLLNAGNSYLALQQQLNLPTWYTNNYLAISFVKNKFVQRYKAGFNVQQQELNSELLRQQNNQATELISEQAVNNLDWRKSRIYADATYEFTGDKLKASLSIPLSYNQIRYNDPSFNFREQLNKIFINPTLNLKYQVASETYITTNYGFKNDLGGVEDIYRGLILKNYRTIYSNDAPVFESKTHHGGIGVNFRRAIQMIFFNVYANYSDVELNTISAFTLTNNIQQRIVLPLVNHSKNFSINSSASKYLFALRSTINAGYSFMNNTYQQLQNDELLSFQSQTMSYKVGLESKVTDFLTISYSGNLSISSNKALQNSLDTRFRQLRQQSTVSITTVKNVYLNLSAEHLFTSQALQPNLNYLFADANLKYKMLKIKTDVELGVSNLTNIKNFEAVYLSANSLSTGSYQIPGRVAMLKVRFNF